MGLILLHTGLPIAALVAFLLGFLFPETPLGHGYAHGAIVFVEMLAMMVTVPIAIAEFRFNRFFGYPARRRQVVELMETTSAYESHPFTMVFSNLPLRMEGVDPFPAGGEGEHSNPSDAEEVAAAFRRIMATELQDPQRYNALFLESIGAPGASAALETDIRRILADEPVNSYIQVTRRALTKTLGYGQALVVQGVVRYPRGHFEDMPVSPWKLMDLPADPKDEDWARLLTDRFHVTNAFLVSRAVHPWSREDSYATSRVVRHDILADWLIDLLKGLRLASRAGDSTSISIRSSMKRRPGKRWYRGGFAVAAGTPRAAREEWKELTPVVERAIPDVIAGILRRDVSPDEVANLSARDISKLAGDELSTAEPGPSSMTKWALRKGITYSANSLVDDLRTNGVLTFAAALLAFGFLWLRGSDHAAFAALTVAALTAIMSNLGGAFLLGFASQRINRYGPEAKFEPITPWRALVRNSLDLVLYMLAAAVVITLAWVIDPSGPSAVWMAVTGG